MRDNESICDEEMDDFLGQEDFDNGDIVDSRSDQFYADHDI